MRFPVFHGGKTEHVTDIPDRLVLKRHRDLEGVGRSGIWVRRAVIDGDRPARGDRAARRVRPAPVDCSCGDGAAILSVYSPTAMRGGDFMEARFHITAKRELKNARLAARPRLGRGALAQHDRALAGVETSENGRLAFELGRIRAGQSYILFMQFQVNPTNLAWHRPQNVDLLDGTTPVLARPPRPDRLSLMDLVLRAIFVFGFMILLTRVIGKRELGSLQPFDLVLLIILGDALQQGLTQDDYSLTGAVLVVGTIAVLQVGVSWLTFRFPRVRPILEGEPLIIVEDGKPIAAQPRPRAADDRRGRRGCARATRSLTSRTCSGRSSRRAGRSASSRSGKYAHRVIRTALFVPAHRDGWVEKAVRAKPDAVILDLEDSVPPSEKDAARALVGASVATAAAAGVVAMVRPADADDLDACVVEGLTALVLPKIGTAEDIKQYAAADAAVGLVVTLETALGYLNAAELARAPGVIGLFAATGKGADVQRELGYRPTPAGLETLYYRSHAVLAARAARLSHILSGPWQELADLDGLRERCSFDRSLGFTGAVLIHPGGVAIANEAFTPGPEELEYHHGLVEAYEEAARAGIGAVDYRGDHVDAAHYRTSLSFLEDARRAGFWKETGDGREVLRGLRARDVYEHAIRRTVTETDNVWFSALTHNPQPLHIDEEFARTTIHGTRIVNSMFTLALVVGLGVEDTTFGTTLGNLGFDEVAFPAPVRHGDTIHAETEVVAKRESKSRPGTGIVTYEHRGFNQDDVLVCRCRQERADPDAARLGRRRALELGDLGFPIPSIAAMTRCDFPPSGSESSSVSTLGTTCQDRPNRSLSRTARALLASLGELLPVVVDLGLVGAVDLERQRLGEGVLGPAVQRQERLAVELEADRHHRPLRAWAGGAVAGDLDDPRVGEDRRVQLRRLLSFGVEPETGCDVRHGYLLRVVSCV